MRAALELVHEPSNWYRNMTRSYHGNSTHILASKHWIRFSQQGNRKKREHNVQLTLGGETIY